MAKKTKQAAHTAHTAAPAASKPAAPDASPGTHKVAVVATRTGYYGLRRIRDGETFQMKLAEGQTLPSWVEPAPRGNEPTPARGRAAPPPPPGAEGENENVI